MTYAFCEDFFTGDFFAKLQNIYPQVKLRFREELSINNKKIPYEDFTKMVFKEDSSFSPLVLTQSTEKSRVVDCLPLLCVGMSECLLTQTKLKGDTLSIFEEHLMMRLKKYGLSEEELLRFLHISSVSTLEFNSPYGLVLTYNLRMGTSSYGQYFANRIARYLYIIGCIHPKLFAEIFFDFMQWQFVSMCIYYDEDFAVVGKCVKGDNDNVASVSKEFFKNDIDFNYFTMKTPKKVTRKLTNCRGLAIAVLNVFILSLVEGTYNSDIVFREGCINQLIESAYKCLGDDIVKQIFTGELTELKYKPEKLITGNLTFYPNRRYSLEDGSSFIRECYEEEFLFRRAYGVSYNEGVNKHKYRDINMHYFNHPEFVASASTLFAFCLDEDDLNSTAIKADAKRLRSELAKRDVTISTLEKRLASQVEQYEKTNNALAEDYEVKLKELQYQLDQKNQIIENLAEKNSILNEKMRSFYSEEDFEEDFVIKEEDSVPILETLNGFSFLLLGGREGFSNKIEERGWKNVTQVNSVNSATLSSKANFDFIIIATKFVAHNIVRAAESTYSDLLDRVIYFNGTNVDLLMKVTADFINNYMK